MVTIPIVTSSITDVIPMVKKPTTPIELLENIKFAIDNHLLLRQDFYIDENLMQFFGGNRVKWLDNHSFLKVAEVLDLNGLFENSNQYTGMGIYITFQTIDKNGKPSNDGTAHGHGIVASGHDSRLTSDAVQSVFGPAVSITDPYLNDNLKHPTPLMPKTNEFGNKKLTYAFKSAIGNSSIWFIFNGDGTVNRFSFDDEGK